MWPPAHPLCRAKAGIGGMAWWEGGGDSWEGKEVRWWATDRLVRGPTVNLAAFRSLRPSTCWILADREGGGVAVEGKCGVRNPQTASWSTPNMVVSPANRPGGRGDRRGYSRPARRDVPTAGVWCVPGWPVTTPPWYVTGNARIDVGRSEPRGSIFDLEIREPRRASEPAGRQSACGANAGECSGFVFRWFRNYM